MKTSKLKTNIQCLLKDEQKICLIKKGDENNHNYLIF